MGEKISIPLAQATVGDEIQIEPLHDQTVEVLAGRPFKVAFAYRVYETSTDEDSWRFRLAATLVGEDEALAEIRLRDRRILRDDIWAHLSQEHTCPEAGEYVMEWTAESELTRRTWNSELAPEPVAKQTLSGKLTVVARAVADATPTTEPEAQT